MKPIKKNQIGPNFQNHLQLCCAYFTLQEIWFFSLHYSALTFGRIFFFVITSLGFRVKKGENFEFRLNNFPK